MQHCDIMVENVRSRSQINLLNAASREKMLHRYVLFSAKKNICKNKIQKWLKLIWRWPELKQSETDLAQMILASLPRNKLFRSDSVSKLKSNFSSKICFTLISVLDLRSLKQLMAPNYRQKLFQSCEVKERLSKNIFTGCGVTYWIEKETGSTR